MGLEKTSINTDPSTPLMGSTVELSETQEHIEDAFKKEGVKSYLKGHITLNPTISLVNFISFIGTQIVAIFIVLNIDNFQLPLLEIKYGISKSNVDTVNTIALIFDICFKLMLSPLYGYLCDKIGRKFLLIYGLVSFVGATLLFPRFSEIPYFILVRLLFANGVVAFNIPPLVADYIEFSTRGRVSALLTFVTALSGYIASFFQQSDDLTDTLDSKYLYLAIGSGTAGLLCCLGVKGGDYHKTLFNDPSGQRIKHLLKTEGNAQEITDTDRARADLMGPEIESQQEAGLVEDVIKEVEEEENDPTKRKFKLQKIIIGFQQAKNPWILMGFALSFMALAQGGILTFVLVSWVIAKTNDPNQATQAYALGNWSMLALMIASVVLGYFSDKMSKFKFLLGTLITAMLGVVFIVLAPSPYNWMPYFALILTGIGSAGLAISSTQYLSSYAEPRYRGAVSAAGQVMTVIGFAYSSVLGVYLVQFNPNLPLLMFGGVCGFTLILLVYLYSKSRVMKKLE